jgi:hypothetical protein
MARLAASVRSERRLLADALQCFVRAPASAWTFRTLGHACRVRGDELQRRYRSPELLYRRAVLAAFTGAGAKLRDGPPLGEGLSSRAAAERAAHAAAVFGAPSYQAVTYILVRDGTALPWVAEEHRSCALRPAAYDIARGFSGPLRPGEIPVALDAVEAVLERLQRGMMLPRLVPAADAREPDDNEAICEAAAALVKAAEAARASSHWGMARSASKYR